MEQKLRKLKKVVIREELYAVTNDTMEAILLGQLIYWQERVSDIDKYISEEKVRCANDGTEFIDNSLNGWIYKTSKQLLEECMLNISEVTVRRYLQKLIDSNYISCRNNPNHKWDKTLQYRVNLSFIIKSIKMLGYDGLSGYSFSKLQNEYSYNQNEAAIPEITTEITTDNKEHTIVCKKENNAEACASPCAEPCANTNANPCVKSIADEWRHDYDAYKQLVCSAAETLKADVEFKEKQEMYFPNVNFELSIDKGCDYWLSEQGYRKCKAAKTKISMLARLKNNFDKNRIYYQQGFKPKADMLNTLQKDTMVINGTEYK